MDEQSDVDPGVDPAAFARMLDAHPDAKAFVPASPNEARSERIVTLPRTVPPAVLTSDAVIFGDSRYPGVRA